MTSCLHNFHNLVSTPEVFSLSEKDILIWELGFKFCWMREGDSYMVIFLF